MPGAGCMHCQQVDSQPGGGGDLMCLQLLGEDLKRHCCAAGFRSELRPCASTCTMCTGKSSLPQGGMSSSLSQVPDPACHCCRASSARRGMRGW